MGRGWDGRSRYSNRTVTHSNSTVIVSSPSYIVAACTSVSAYICPPLQIVHLRDVPLPYRIRSELKIVVHYWPQLLTPGTLHVLAVAIVTE